MMKLPNLRHSILALVCTSLLFSCGSEEEVKEADPRPVKYTEVATAGSATERVFSGTAKSEKVINLSFRSSGVLVQLDVKLGQLVKKNQLLAKLDNVQARLSLERAITSVNSAESQMNTAKLGLDRIRVLYEKGSASLTDFESAKNSYKTAQQSYESAKREVSIQREQVRYGFLYAPEDGVITAVSAEVDENIQAGQAIAVLNAGVEMEISLGLPESIINNVSLNMPVDVNFSSLEGQSFKGRVTELSPAVDLNTSTYPAMVTLDRVSDDVKSGMAANVTFALGEDSAKDMMIRVPAQAVGEDSEGRFVFVITQEADKTVVKKSRVKVGDLSSAGFQIVEGLKPGQKIATAGLQTLLDGQEVTIQ
ncbi:efflux RND transporter periplasmic adaptor subunit [Gilvibacter sediminis]|uniref:efflux RND transporter periplasmic adaptor subunit n=1 Tax=Gilvibacter sediminis TaxID=379071 RepID=UPI00234FFA27|nr:efflux RND transporter periplasmic adaptor subunit [Gilvibacter sediminis]MDC7999149.1 efflux RND transporter periplasmic adaptor subunit [Gilvibacter sediminis]